MKLLISNNIARPYKLLSSCIMNFRNLLKRKLLLDLRTKANTMTNEMTTKSHIRKGQRDSIHVSFHSARTLYLKPGKVF